MFFIEHEGGEWCFSNGRLNPQILMISDSVNLYVCSLPFERHQQISVVELKNALNEVTIPLNGIDFKLWNRFSIPNTSESKNRFFLESIPSPTTQHSGKPTHCSAHSCLNQRFVHTSCNTHKQYHTTKRAVARNVECCADIALSYSFSINNNKYGITYHCRHNIARYFVFFHSINEKSSNFYHPASPSSKQLWCVDLKESPEWMIQWFTHKDCPQ